MVVFDDSWVCPVVGCKVKDGAFRGNSGCAICLFAICMISAARAQKSLFSPLLLLLLLLCKSGISSSSQTPSHASDQVVAGENFTLNIT